ncbi:MAG: hypothetical protein KDA84_28575, partial [Planctomycetaceae bacterium]|nr:hypothetical protein [Planctomycetaceae bacterium]
MREVSPGDLVFSFRDRKIAAIGVVASNCYEAPIPGEFGVAGNNWEQVGWQADVDYTEVKSPIIPKQHIERIRPLLPEKYSPLQQNGDGLQSVYLAEISRELGDLLLDLLRREGNEIVVPIQVPQRNTGDTIRREIENHIIREI